MGNYANWNDVAGRYPKAAAVADSDEMQESYIAGVEAVMNSYLSKQFTTPVVGDPPLLKDICIDLVYCKINFNRDKGVPKLKEQTMMLLKALSTTEMLLTDTEGAVITSEGQAVWSSSQDYESTHSMLGPPDDLIDPDLKEDLISERG